MTHVRTNSRAIRARKRSKQRPPVVDRRNITRIDHARTHGWWVRFQRGRRADGTRIVVSKHFADGVHGGKRKALAAAVRWRDRTKGKVPAVRRTATVPAGYGYVKRVFLKRRVGWHEVWLAWIRLPGRRAASSSWSIARWGVTAAKQQAEAYLRRKRRELRAG